jgi:3-deoxy-D-manno-octulosonic acid kinase
MMDAMHTASGSRESFRDERGQGAIVFDPTRLQQATPALFEPAAYGDQAQAVRGQGGRGAAWFVRGAFGDGVLRHYRRGGWMARLSDDGFLWRGEGRVRSLLEYRLLAQLRGLGLPVPAPIAACYRHGGGRYRAAIIVERIAGAEAFAARVAAAGAAAPWSDVGREVGRCHRLGAHHADLNANNLLLDPAGAVFLIDWDKGRLEAASGHWCRSVLDRLERSLRKECRQQPPAVIAEGMAQLRAAHDREQLA